MNQDSKELLRKLIRKRPKPTKKELLRFFKMINEHPIEELMSILENQSNRSPLETSGHDLNSETKKRLRKIGGKVSDFVPYLLMNLYNQGLIGSDTKFNEKSPFKDVLALFEDKLGSDVQTALEDAFAAYIADNDTRYKLKSARG